MLMLLEAAAKRQATSNGLTPEPTGPLVYACTSSATCTPPIPAHGRSRSNGTLTTPDGVLMNEWHADDALMAS